MTVCIVAVCRTNGQQMIIGASDRMITAGDIEFEPPLTKIFALTRSCVALVSGDADSYSAICHSTRDEIMRHTLTDIGEISDLFAKQFAAFRSKQAEQAVLAPLGLDLKSFIDRQREMTSEFTNRIADELYGKKVGVDAIVAGVDATGAHIYVVNDPGHAMRNDDIGFAAIGWGQPHAESQFMFMRYSNWWNWARAMLLTYIAKKRAEVAPGVGSETDMFSIGPGLDGYSLFGEEPVKELDKIYKEARADQDEIGEKAFGKAEEYVKRQAETETADQEGVREDAEEGQREEKEEA